MTDHPITPPPELRRQWIDNDDFPFVSGTCDLLSITRDRLNSVMDQAARWGADQELEACCEWLRNNGLYETRIGHLRALCAELAEALHEHTCLYKGHESELVARARALLAEPVAEGPTDEDLVEALRRLLIWPPRSTEAACEQDYTFARAVLARWGRPAAAPAPEPGEVGELVLMLHHAGDALRLHGVSGTASACDRAAELLERPTPQPVAVSERLPGPGEWIWHCYAGVRFWEHGRYNGRQFFIGDGPESQPATHWLPANALPTPEATND